MPAPKSAADPASPPPTPSPLPDPRHAARVPAQVGPRQLERLRQVAYALPQVVTPADWGEDATDKRLDQLGLVQLQKAAAGGRPSRWLEPRLFDAALAHLAAVGSGPGARPLMLERTAVLEALGVAREGGAFTRLATQVLQVPVPEAPPWRLELRHQVPLDDRLVWDFHRSGDETALRAALGPEPPHPQAGEVVALLARLVARSQAYQPQRLDELRPRLQAECARPQPLPELLAACTRAQDRWEHRVTELATLETLTHDLAFQRYPDTFVHARRLQRSVTLYVGPPNSGKTHAAFERLAQAHDGAYLAPLRLLALEGRDRLAARGVACSLLTGEENVPAPDARVVSSTIEMVATDRPVDVAVIDEAQMIFDASRGWAWTQAIVAVPANELVIICSDYAVPVIQGLLGLCGERCSVRLFERKQHVQLLPRPVGLAALQRGDAVVAFSRRDVLALRDRIAAAGHVVSVIYGALPPEVRRREAERFAQGESDILVATDAIGMGLNLPIRRVLFSTLSKFDGAGDRPLEPSEVHQIAGRAGRFGLHEEGFAGVLEDAEPGALRELRELLAQRAQAPEGFKAPVAPNPWHVKTIAARLHRTRLREVLGVFVEQLRLDDTHFEVAELEQMLLLAESLDRCAAKLPLRQRFVYAQAPVDTRTESQLQEFLDWASRHALLGQAGKPWFLDAVDGHSRLDRMEQALRGCTLWLWLDLRFPGIYGHVEEVHALRAALNEGIERQLKGKRPLAQVRTGRRGGRFP
ncbi:MAG: helicase [Piscinibacter sp.]|nr:helicase [Piscinibacter sp.]